MFKNLLEFGYTRTKKEAFGFYLAYLVLMALVSGLLGGIIGLFTPEQPFGSAFQTGVTHGAFFAIVVSLILVVLVLRAKKLLGDFKYLVLIPITGLLSLFGGALLGLIPIAFLATRPQGGEHTEEKVAEMPSISS
jgi:hypothetical protein